MLSFEPWPGLHGPHLQTLVGNLVSRPRRLPSETWEVPLPDGDRLALEVSRPDGWTPRQPTALLVHGLTGSHRSSYMVRLAAGLTRAGVRAVRLNLRGCGSGAGLARRPYHAGLSDDVAAAVELLHGHAPRSPLTLIGFSLGGNIVLKLAGELGPRAPGLLERVLAVCPAANLDLCWRRLARPANRVYERTFVRELVAAARQLEARGDGPALPQAATRPGISVYRFDDLYTAPVWGFASAADYYQRASARGWIPRIEVPGRILLSDDDPIVDPAVLDGVELPAGLRLHRVPRGGHLGFVGHPLRPGGHRWMDRLLVRWARG